MPLSSDADRLCGLFDDLVLVAARAAATEWGYPAPDQDWADAFAARMPPGLRTVLGRAFETDSASVVDGHRFVLRDLDGKGPYAFFSRSSEREQPAPNWEYFVQLAIWASVDQDVRGRGFVAGFEDGLMDVSVRTTEGELVWAIEVKERSNQLPALLQGIRSHADGVDLQSPDRGNDPLRKAKYLVEHRPPWFTLWAIGARLDFSVRYTGETSFELVEDVLW